MAQTKIKEIQFDPPTAAEFDRLLEEQTPQYSKWSDLENNKIYTVTNATIVNTQKGEAMVLSLRIITNKISPPLYIRPLGLKPCKKNPSNKYHAYDLVVRK